MPALHPIPPGAYVLVRDSFSHTQYLATFVRYAYRELCTVKFLDGVEYIYARDEISSHAVTPEGFKTLYPDAVSE